jgi:thiamine-phosphate pyrophosphorylase
VRKLSDCLLYGIVDLAYVEASRLSHVAEAMIEGGVDLIQLRGKNADIDALTDLARQLHEVAAPASVPLVVNDHAEIASRVPVEGVHVGQDDASIDSVRRTVNRPIWVGKSTHNLKQAISAQPEGADYIGFGPIYATPTKPDYAPVGLTDVNAVHQDVTVPIFCIGGIKRDNLATVLAAGAKRVAIVSGLLKASDITAYARACKDLLVAASHRLEPI